MKARNWKSVTAEIAGLLTGVLIGTVVMQSAIEVEAADTFLGIQNLITEVSGEYQEKQSKYTILEVVPDRAAAEIGYLFDGYEPVLSEWDAQEKRWVGWRERLAACADEEERRRLIEGDGTPGIGLKAGLEAYYAKKGITQKPVIASTEPYAESDVPAEGYEMIQGTGKTLQGYFAAGSAEDTYQLAFGRTALGTDEFSIGKYYRVGSVLKVVADTVTPEASQIRKSDADGKSYVYVQNSLGDYEFAGLLENVDDSVLAPETVSSSDGVSAGDAGQNIYLITFEAILNRTEAETGTTPLYAVTGINRASVGTTAYNYGCYHLVESADGAAFTLGAETFYCKNAFENQEWFKQYVLNMTKEEYGNFPVEVISYTPQELAETLAATGALPEFDFLYINSGKSAGWTYSAGAADMAVPKGGDVTAEVGRLLFETVQAGKLPCLVDGNVIFTQENRAVSTAVTQNTELKNTNLFKLCTLFGQNTLDRILMGTTQDFQALNVDTLWNTLADGYEDGNFTTNQVYFHTGAKSIINNDFSTFSIYRPGMDMKKGFQKVLDEIQLENLYRAADTSASYAMLSEEISEAGVLRHIMNYKYRRNAEAKKTMNVLEIQPAKTKDGKATLTLGQVQKWAADVETLNVTVMTTAEFIGKVETLNDKYDLIYIGTCKDHMNTVKGVADSPAAGSTVFNDHAMDGLVYYHTGDMRYSSLELSGMLDTDYVNGNRAESVYFYTPVRYGGNDITKEKKEALISYLDGSYPVVVSEDFFESPATVYQDINYRGYSVNLGVGEYRLSDLQNLGIANDDITSLKVKDGYRLIAYWDDNFTSESVAFTADTSSLVSVPLASNAQENWNDKISAIRVEQVPDSAPQRAIDTEHIDNSSYMYEFVKQALDEKRTNFYSFGEIEQGSQLFGFYLNRPKVTLVNTSANGNRKDGDEIYYIRKNNGKYTLEYHFTIANEGAAVANTRYRARFLIDVNADGKFSSQEELGDIRITSGGNNVAADQLYAGREYVLTRTVPDGYKGVLPWKLEISQTENTNIYCFMDGYTKLEGLEKETIKILQISRDQVLEPDPWWWGREHEQLYSLAEQINGKKTQYDTLRLNSTGAYPVKTEAYSTDEKVDGYESSLYHVLIYGGEYEGVTYKGIADDFDIDVDFMTIHRFENEYRAGNINMADYNMLILGFSDAYGDFDIVEGEQDSPIGAIVNFINSGKSVLFAHDTTSYFNYSKSKGNQGVINRNNLAMGSTDQYHNASTLNFYIRGLVGMDRYGVMTMPVLKTGVGLTAGSEDWNNVLASGKDIAFVPKSGRTQTVPYTQGYTYSIINAKDKHTEANVSAVDYTTEETGRSQVWKNQYLNIKYDTAYYHDNYTDASGVGYPDTGEIPLNYNGEVTNLLVTQTNKGQITQYPYKLAETFQVASTHAQYYQLDFTADDDKDGQSDLVVWYCLGGRVNEGGQYQNTIYSMSPNDVSNNYYIYNKGNITYTGMGHSAGRSSEDIPYSTQNCTVEEAKLFINTMIAAYNAGIKSPSVSVQKSAEPDSPKETVLYRYYDNDFALDSVDDATNSYEQIYFTVSDVNFVKGSRRLSMKLFYDSADGTQNISVDGVSRKVKTLDIPIYNASTKETVNADGLVSGGIYYVLVPKTVLQDCDVGLNLYFEAQSIINSYNKTYITDKVYAKLEVLKTYLFDLD